jgi:hypothetical protein
MSEKIIIPTKLSECFQRLDGIFSDAPDGDWFKEASEEEAISQSHHGLGTWIRDNWGLWDVNEQLHKYFKKLGLQHPDDMSGVILTSYHRHLNNKELELDGQIKYYIEFWNNKGNKEGND